MSNEKCGIYRIQNRLTLKSYVGSSYRIYRRWYEHRNKLRKGTHKSPRLQQAWNKHGEMNFVFSILEECARGDLFTREQFHIDAIKPDYNSMPQVRIITPEMRAKMNAANALTKRTHCPRGHEYSEANSYFNGSGDKICRACNKERQRERLAKETPEQTAARLAKCREYQMRIREKRLARQKLYTAAHKAEKQAYDRARYVPRPPIPGKEKVRAALAARGIFLD